MDSDNAPTTPAKLRGTTRERSATPQQAGTQLLIADGVATARDPTTKATRAMEVQTQATAAAATTQLAATQSEAAPPTIPNATWTANAPTMGMTKLITLPKMVDSTKILTRSRLEIKQFNEWCQTHHVNQMSTQEQRSLIAQCFPQETLVVMELQP